MDRVGADFARTVEMIKDRLEATPVVVQLPIGSEAHFTGVVDLLGMKALVGGEGMGETWSTSEIPADMLEAAEVARHDIVDIISNYDDSIMEKFVGEEEITIE